MKIVLPPKKGVTENVELELKQLVVVGANGAGKTRFGSYIEEKNQEVSHRVSAQKSLIMPDSVGTTSIERAEKEFLYGVWQPNNSEWYESWSGRQNYRWGGKVNTSLLNDFEKLMVLLHTEEYEQSLEYKENGGAKPITKLDRIQTIWEEVLPHRKLQKKAGVVETYPTGQTANAYSASEMSDGERVIFYLAGEVICAPEGSIVIIDEPEMHIHASLIKKTFDLIEKERPDCAFVYLTHSIDFAFSRQEAVKVWAKSYEGNVWDYEILDPKTPIPEQLYLEVLGSRNPVIFIEGDNSSIDYKIYSQVYPSHTLKPVDSCNKVIQTTKAFNEEHSFHHIKSNGIVDRDRREQTDVNMLTSKGVWVLDVAEVENLLLLEDVVKAAAIHMDKNTDEVFNAVKQNVISFFAEQKESQVLSHYKEILKRELLELTNFGARDIVAAIREIDAGYGSIDKRALFDNIDAEFQHLLDTNDYEGILRVFNLKNALIPKSKVCEETGIRGKDGYCNLIVSLLKKNDATSSTIRSKIDSKIIKTATA